MRRAERQRVQALQRGQGRKRPGKRHGAPAHDCAGGTKRQQDGRAEGCRQPARDRKQADGGLNVPHA